ncbi:MAG TPA: apolipoprotein N-acyltransferase [Tepidisphaeraceae bacterium]|jgi:apolipoprotein N-acyltransferase
MMHTTPGLTTSFSPGTKRWYASIHLPTLTILLLTLAFPPVRQFYLGWVALVPWILYVRKSRSPVRAFVSSTAMGFVLNAINMYWLTAVTWPGGLALMGYMSLYWGIAAVVTRGLLRRFPPTRFDHAIIVTLMIPTLFVCLELIRAHLWTGIPWLNLSTTQVSILTMCQLADTFGAYGITFWVVALNSLTALYLLARGRTLYPRQMLAAGATVAVLLLSIFCYGRFRLSQSPLVPGPTVTVVQANFPQDNSGRKGATEQQIVDFHISASARALADAKQRGAPSDLVAWSETMTPPINSIAREYLVGSEYGKFISSAHDRMTSLAREYDTTVIAGGIFYGGFREVPDGSIMPINRRNTAYFITPLGELSPTRYDKIHLVPFGEYIPFKDSVPFLYNFFLKLSPYDYDYTLVPGSTDDLTVFMLTQHQTAKPTRFVVPICFEDLDAALVARMFRAPHGKKRADMFVTITNDGWFASPELHQHLTTAQLRCIENRVPAARSVNTGMSGFIDSVGRAHNLLPIHTEGASTATLQLDSRLTIYTQFGDWFPTLCTFVIGLMSLWLMYDASRSPARLAHHLAEGESSSFSFNSRNSADNRA